MCLSIGLGLEGIFEKIWDTEECNCWRHGQKEEWNREGFWGHAWWFAFRRTGVLCFVWLKIRWSISLQTFSQTCWSSSKMTVSRRSSAISEAFTKDKCCTSDPTTAKGRMLQVQILQQLALITGLCESRWTTSWILVKTETGHPLLHIPPGLYQLFPSHWLLKNSHFMDMYIYAFVKE